LRVAGKAGLSEERVDDVFTSVFSDDWTSEKWKVA
jgi:hypothetical protein